jgi:hypothetical protein
MQQHQKEQKIMPWENIVEKAEVMVKATAPLTEFEKEIRKADRTVIPEYIWEPSYKIREPIYNFEELMLIARTHWVLKNVFGTIIRETMSPGWRLEPAFIGKCPKCKKEFKDPPPDNKCPKDKESLVPPDTEQEQRALELLTKPNEENTFYELLKSTLMYDLSLDNYFMTISYKYVINPEPEKASELLKIPAELNVEDPRYFRVVADDKGHIGDPNQLFCPECWKPDFVYAPPTVTCLVCGKPLQKTAYVQRVGGAVKARFTKDEVIHGSSDRWVPNLYGESRIICLWKILLSIQAMDDFNIELYTEGKLGSIVNFPGHEQEEVNEIMDQFEQEALRKRVYDPVLRRFRTSKKVRTMMIASKDPIKVTRVMEDFKRMQSIEFYKFWRAACGAVYSAQPVFTGDIESGKAGTTPMMQVTVQDRAIREHHKNREDIMNNRVFPAFNITDWKFRFNTLELRDELRLTEIGQIKANTAFTWLKAGFDVRLNERGELEVSGEGELTEQGKKSTPSPPEKIGIESEATGEIRERTGRFAPKPAGQQAENYNKSMIDDLILLSKSSSSIDPFMEACKVRVKGWVKDPEDFCGAFWKDKEQWYHGPQKTSFVNPKLQETTTEPILAKEDSPVTTATPGILNPTASIPKKKRWVDPTKQRVNKEDLSRRA